MAGDCRNPELCCNCKSEDHRARYCRYSWHHSSPPSPGHNSPPQSDRQQMETDPNPPPGPDQQQPVSGHSPPRPAQQQQPPQTVRKSNNIQIQQCNNNQTQKKSKLQPLLPFSLPSPASPPQQPLTRMVCSSCETCSKPMTMTL